MARTHRSQERAEKEHAILEAAEQRLKTGGVESVTVAGVARDLGVVPNSIYWYFPSRDHLVVATANRRLQHLLTAKPPARLTTVEAILWFVDQLGDLHHVRAALKERSDQSPVIAGFLSDLASLMTGLLANALRPLVKADELDLIVDAFTAVVHDTATEAISDERRRDIRRFTLDRLLGREGNSGPGRVPNGDRSAP